MHFGTFQLTDEAIDEPLLALDRALEERRISDEEFTVHATVAPPRVFPDQAQHQDTDGTHSRRPPPPPRFGPGSVPPFDQVAVPPQHRVRAYQQPHPAQRLR